MFGVHRSIVSPLGEDRSMISLVDTDKDIVAATGVLGIVPNEVILIGVLGSVPVDTIVTMAERRRMVVGCRSSKVSIIP